MIYISCLLYSTNHNFGYRDYIRSLICSSPFENAVFIFPADEKELLRDYLRSKNVCQKCIFLKVISRQLLIQSLPLLLKLKAGDTLVHTYGYGCLINNNINQEVIVHDLQYLHPGINHSSKWFFHRNIFFSLIRDKFSSIIFFSPATLFEYILEYGVPNSYRIIQPDYTSLIPKRVIQSQFPVSQEYYLAVSVGRHYKNISYLINEMTLYCENSTNPKLLYIITDASTALHYNQSICLPKNIHIMHSISDFLLHRLFKSAYGFIQCSSYEGWSIPLDLAIRYEVPNIICNDIPIARFVCRNYPQVRFLCMPSDRLREYL